MPLQDSITSLLDIPNFPQNIAGAYHHDHHFVSLKDHILRCLPHCQVRIFLIFSNKSEEMAVSATTTNATTNATHRRRAAAADDNNDDVDNNDDNNGIDLARP
jgi:hypothetical protein